MVMNDVVHVRVSSKETYPQAARDFTHPARTVAQLGIEPGMSVADFGAGSGAYVFALAEQLAGSGHLYAIDVQQDLLRRIHNEALRRGIKNVQIIWADLEQPRASKLADHSIEVVLISNLLFQTDNKVAVLDEARRIVRPHGKVVIIDWSDSFSGMGPRKQDIVTKETAQALLSASGLEYLRECPVGAHHWGIIARPFPLA